MLPLIVIGATDRVTEILTPYAEVGHISYHPTAGDAYRVLDDDASALPLDAQEPYDEQGRWLAHVAYGPKVYGDLCTARTGTAMVSSVNLPHSGHTLILGLDVHDPKLAIKAVGAEPSEEPDHTMIWQAAVNARADMILDLESTDAVATLVRYLEWKSEVAS